MTVWVITKEVPNWDNTDWSIVAIHATEAKAKAELNLLQLTANYRDAAHYALEPIEVKL